MHHIHQFRLVRTARANTPCVALTCRLEPLPPDVNNVSSCRAVREPLAINEGSAGESSPPCRTAQGRFVDRVRGWQPSSAAVTSPLGVFLPAGPPLACPGSRGGSK